MLASNPARWTPCLKPAYMPGLVQTTLCTAPLPAKTVKWSFYSKRLETMSQDFSTFEPLCTVQYDTLLLSETYSHGQNSTVFSICLGGTQNSIRY